MSFIIKKKHKSAVKRIMADKKYVTNVTDVTLKKFEILTIDGDLAVEFYSDSKAKDQNELIKEILNL